MMGEVEGGKFGKQGSWLSEHVDSNVANKGQVSGCSYVARGGGSRVPEAADPKGADQSAVCRMIQRREGLTEKKPMMEAATSAASAEKRRRRVPTLELREGRDEAQQPVIIFIVACATSQAGHEPDSRRVLQRTEDTIPAVK